MIAYQERPLVFFDIETTGLRAGYNEATELAFIHEKLGGLCVQVKPQYPERFEEEASRISNYSELEWQGAPALKDVVSKVHEYTYEAIIVGHNIVGFDIPFMNGNLEMIGSDYRIPIKMNSVIDTQMLALALLTPLGLKTISLRACCNFFGISNEGQHHAYDDCLRTKSLYECLMEKFPYDDGKPKQKDLWK